MDRVKTTVMLPRKLSERVTDLSDRLGIGRNAVICLGAAMVVITLSPLVRIGRRRVAIVKDAEAAFQKIIKAAAES